MLFQHRPTSPKPSADFQISSIPDPIIIKVDEPIRARLLDFVRDWIGNNSYRCITGADIVAIDHRSFGGKPYRLKSLIKTCILGDNEKLDQVIVIFVLIMDISLSNFSF